jgi:hypothetical protein
VEWRLLRADLVALTPPPRAALGRPPFWESLHRAGVDTAVIRFDFTEPPDDQATIVVSSRVGADTWEVVGVKSESAEVFAPPELETDLARLFSPTTSADATLPPRIARTTARPPGRNGDLELQMLRTGLDIDQRSFAAARFVVTRRPQTEVLALYLGGFDGVCHAFWPYRFPEAYGADAPGSDAVAAFGGVIDHYLEYLDQELGALLAVYRVPPNVILV